LAGHPAPAGTVVDREVADQAVRLAQPGAARDSAWPQEVTDAWEARGVALAAYRSQLPADADVDAVVEAVLHMHHNRAIGVDQDSERTCRRLARQAALAWRAGWGEVAR
jgi:thiopeptide-type bacteriocin biosynthesis protein